MVHRGALAKNVEAGLGGPRDYKSNVFRREADTMGQLKPPDTPPHTDANGRSVIGRSIAAGPLR